MFWPSVRRRRAFMVPGLWPGPHPRTLAMAAAEDPESLVLPGMLEAPDPDETCEVYADTPASLSGPCEQVDHAAAATIDRPSGVAWLVA
jgi:hypothetical protein